MSYPKMLYRDGNGWKWDGRPTDSRIVASAEEHEQAVSDGWQAAKDYWASPVPRKSLLDGSAREIEGQLSSLSLDELERLKSDEQAGKTRKSVIALLDEAIDAKLAE